MVDIRHRIHQDPELSNREEKTAALVADYLRKLGLEVQTGVAKHGVVALLKGGRPGAVVAVRADIDALPVTEDTNLPFASKVRTTYLGQEVGVMHAVRAPHRHTAVQLGGGDCPDRDEGGLAGYSQVHLPTCRRGRPSGRGGRRVTDGQGGRAAKSAGRRRFFGLHAFSEMAVGDIGYSEGPALSAADTWEVKIIGRQAHGARPETPQLIRSSPPPQFVAGPADNQIVVRSPDTSQPWSRSGTIHGGQRHNIIPAEVTLTGTIRTFRSEMSTLAEARLRAILKGVTEAAGATGQVLDRYERGTPATINQA